MRLAIACLLIALYACILIGQSPITVGGDRTSGFFGINKTLDWFDSTASGCTAGTGYCVGHTPQGDTYNFTAWMASAAGLPKTSGLPIVGTINDYNMDTPGPNCDNNIGIIQLDVFNWATPLASHIQPVNCMSTYGTQSSHNFPAGWFGALTSGDGITLGTWKNRTIFAIGGNLYLPVERQYSPGDPGVHDATFIMSPDSGAHWCNPYTYWQHSGSPGCDSSNWDANGDAPVCGAASSSSDPCTNAGYTDGSHSSIEYKAFPLGEENWFWINSGVQDGATLPTTPDGCSPDTYICFMSVRGYLMRVNLIGTVTGLADGTDIMDISKHKYYTCPGLTQIYRCPSSDSSNWTSTFANRTPVTYGGYYLGPHNATQTVLFGIMYVDAFKSYLLTGATDQFTADTTVDFYSAPRPEGPWTAQVKTGSVQPPSFFTSSPALGYTVVGSNPPHVQLTLNSNKYNSGIGDGEGSPVISLWDLVLGRQPSGEQLRCDFFQKYVSGACYKFSASSQPGSLPSIGLALSFDFLDQGIASGITNWPYFQDRGQYQSVMVPCDGSAASPTNCGFMNAGHGVSMDNFGIVTSNSGNGGHFRSRTTGSSQTDANAPAAMTGNGTFSVVNTFAWTTVGTHTLGSLWSTGTTASTNTAVGLRLYNFFGIIAVDWFGSGSDYWETRPAFTATAGNYYFVAITNQANGANPITKCWIGQSGVVADACAGQTRFVSGGSPTQTPNTAAGPLLMGIGVNPTTDTADASQQDLQVYSRVLPQNEVELIYADVKSKMAARGVTIQ